MAGCKIACKGGLFFLPHLSGLPHLPGVPHFHVNRPLHEDGGSQAGEVTCVKLPHLKCKRDHIKIRDYLDRRVTPPNPVISPTWGPPPPLHVDGPLVSFSNTQGTIVTP